MEAHETQLQTAEPCYMGLWVMECQLAFSPSLSWTTRSLSTVALCIFALFCPLLSHFLCSITHYSSQQQCQTEYIPMTLQLWCYWTENWEEICKIFSGLSRMSKSSFFLPLICSGFWGPLSHQIWSLEGCWSWRYQFDIY